MAQQSGSHAEEKYLEAKDMFSAKVHPMLPQRRIA
jgi:hypothetical protein